jgi:S-formylglutathione hydrolase FrmB
VILPQDKPQLTTSGPVLYLLHGKGSSALSWMRFSSIERYANKYDLVVIMPEAGRSFYTDMRYGGDYFTYITRELPELCGRMFHMNTSSENTYIAGISMGAYGVLKCALNCPELYAGCVAISPVTDITWRIQDTPINSPAYRDLQGVFGVKPKAAKEDDLFALAESFDEKQKHPRLFFATGDRDKLDQNQRFSDLLNRKGFYNTFVHWDGVHDLVFFESALEKGMSFLFDGLDIHLQ